MYTPYEGFVGTFGVVWRRFRYVWRKSGFFLAVWMLVFLGAQVLFLPVFRFTRGRRTFTFRGKKYPYFCHWYNTTFNNERALEVAIAIDLMKQAKGKRILEVGNVLSHYTDIPRDVLDKYERGKNIIHEDVVEYESAIPYDLIISISTLEHVGFDEHPQDPQKFIRAVRKLQSLLSPKGHLFVTVPVGYNPAIVSLIQKEPLFEEYHYFERVSSKNIWKETTQQRAFSRKFDDPYPFGNAIIIGLSGNWAEWK